MIIIIIIHGSSIKAATTMCPNFIGWLKKGVGAN